MKKSDTQGPTIESERLSMRSLSSADEALYCELYTNAEVMRFVGAPLTRQSASEGFKKSLELMNKPEFERRVVVLMDRASQQPIGISSIRMVDAKKGRAEVGTLLKPGAHEKGFAQECSTALITQAFTRPQVKELVAYSVKDNAAIERLLEDLGFERGGAVRSSAGRPPRVRWTISRNEWSKRCAKKSK
jgi:ribosomal-protein-alanine N-acetyltransferase